MDDLLAVASPGTTARGVLSVPVEPSTEIPYVTVRGTGDGPTLLVTAGVHGAEYASVEAAYRVADLDPERLRGTLVVLPIVNPHAFWTRSVYVNPIDGRNLNRVFPGRALGTYSERLAHWLFERFLTRADAVVDLHGGDLVEALEPFSVYTRGHEASRELAVAFGLPHVVASDSRGMTLEASRAGGVPAIIAEAGGQGLRREEDVSALARGVENVVRHLGMHTDGPAVSASVTHHDGFAWLSAPERGLWFPLVGAGEEVREGQALGTLRDLSGRDLHVFHSPCGGPVLFVVSGLAMNEGDPLLGIGVPARG